MSKVPRKVLVCVGGFGREMASVREITSVYVTSKINRIKLALLVEKITVF